MDAIQYFSSFRDLQQYWLSSFQVCMNPANNICQHHQILNCCVQNQGQIDCLILVDPYCLRWRFHPLLGCHQVVLDCFHHVFLQFLLLGQLCLLYVINTWQGTPPMFCLCFLPLQPPFIAQQLLPKQNQECSLFCYDLI